MKDDLLLIFAGVSAFAALVSLGNSIDEIIFFASASLISLLIYGYFAWKYPIGPSKNKLIELKISGALILLFAIALIGDSTLDKVNGNRLTQKSDQNEESIAADSVNSAPESTLAFTNGVTQSSKTALKSNDANKGNRVDTLLVPLKPTVNSIRDNSELNCIKFMQVDVYSTVEARLETEGIEIKNLSNCPALDLIVTGEILPSELSGMFYYEGGEIHVLVDQQVCYQSPSYAIKRTIIEGNKKSVVEEQKLKSVLEYINHNEDTIMSAVLRCLDATT